MEPHSYPKIPDRCTPPQVAAGAIWPAGSVDAPSVISSISSAMYGIGRALDRFDRASTRLAQAAPGDLVRDRVDQIIAQHTFEANLSTVRSADEMLGALLDITA